jgi:hypothetical protein
MAPSEQCRREDESLIRDLKFEDFAQAMTPDRAMAETIDRLV